MKKLVMIASLLAMTSMMSIPLANAAEGDAPAAMEGNAPKADKVAPEAKKAHKAEKKAKRKHHHHKKKKAEEATKAEEAKPAEQAK